MYTQVFIPELGKVFRCNPYFRLFAAQNPLQEGGGRKGLPRSFLNRFTRVYMQLLQREDLLLIAGALHTRIPRALLERMVGLLEAMHAAATAGDGGDGGGGGGAAAGRRFASLGGPWEFNLRDLLRWADLVERAVVPAPPAAAAGAAAAENAALDDAAEHVARMLFEQRLRAAADRDAFAALWRRAWGRPLAARGALPVVLTPDTACIGRVLLPRRDARSHEAATHKEPTEQDSAMQVRTRTA